MPATGDRITKRKDGLFQGMYTAHTPEGPKRKYIYGRKWPDPVFCTRCYESVSTDSSSSVFPAFSSLPPRSAAATNSAGLR